MASGLRAKLNAIGAAAPRAEKKPARPAGVAVYTDRRDADARLFALDADGLRRIGWCGRIFDVRRCLFLDTETTGLSGGAGTVAFLVGLGYVQDGAFVVEQYLMRDYSAEAEMLGYIARRMEAFDCICTFNGKNFDLPLLKTRFTMCRMQDAWRDVEQLDLLYPARRTWKLRIGSCRLSRIEEIILEKGREGDLPGSEVPRRYFDYLKSGDMNLLEDIIVHNRQDIYTLGTLLAQLCEIYAHPERQRSRKDMFSVGRALENQGELIPARELYKIVAVPPPSGSIAALSEDELTAKAAWRLFLLARKNKDAEAMRIVLEQMLLRRQLPVETNVELSKLYEHHYKNPQRALRYAESAQKYASPEDAEALNHRCKRLKNKIKTETGRKKENGLF